MRSLGPRPVCGRQKGRVSRADGAVVECMRGGGPREMNESRTKAVGSGLGKESNQVSELLSNVTLQPQQPAHPAPVSPEHPLLGSPLRGLPNTIQNLDLIG